MSRHSNRIARQQQSIQVSTSFSGPLPHPNLLAQYNNAFEGCAERLVQMAEKQQSHRMGLETSVIEGNIKAQRLGVHYGFILGAIVLLGGIGLIAFNKPVEGMRLVVGSAATMVSSFAIARFQQWRERKRKASSFPESKN